MTLLAARRVADAVLHEGYLLYPYRASSPKNQVRWQFGILGPAGAVAAGVGEEPSMSAEVLVEPGPGGTVDLLVRFLQVQSRVVECQADGRWAEVDELVVDGARWVPFHEAVSRELPIAGVPLRGTSTDLPFEVTVPGGEEIEQLGDDARLRRTRWPLHGTVVLQMRPGLDPRLLRLTLRVVNGTAWSPGEVAGWRPRDVAARYSFVGTHLLATAHGARFVSLLDGPRWSAADAAACGQERCWPVLVADDDGSDAVLVSPIILDDHPTTAPESAGDLFDATEIDEILTLRVLTLTEQEKLEARGTDPRAAAILARSEALTDEARGRLHGARRDGPAAPWWDAGAEPESDTVEVGGVEVAKGSRVLLRPTRRADAQDLFLAGMTAVVSRVYLDLDGRTHIGVSLADDPGGDLYESTGRFYYFGPEEIEPLPVHGSAR